MQARSCDRLPRILTVVVSLIALAGCLGEGDGQQRILGTPPPPVTGILVDSPVSGVSYESTGGLSGADGVSGITNENGEFQYYQGGQVTFSIGGIVLGTTDGRPVISAVELTGSADPTAQAALNMLVFLQSIDSDADPSNGITVSDATRSAAAGLTLDFNAPDFPSQVLTIVQAITEPDNAIVSEADALNHFYGTYVQFGGTATFGWLFPGFPPVTGDVVYELVFADEFDGDALSTANWNIETGYGDGGWGNNEWQLYTDSPDNLRVEGGNLVISAQCPTPPCGVRDGTITSARINTKDKFEFTYGKIVARIKPATGEAAWPAFWALGAVFPETAWPRAGEIDFMEMLLFFSDDRTTHSTMHWCDETIAPPLPALCFPAENGYVFDTQSRTFPQSLGDDFHIWEADWTPDSVTVSMDGVRYFERAIDPNTMEEFRRDFFLLFNVAMGGTQGSDNRPPSGNEIFPQTMLVDYVRVFQPIGSPAGGLVVDFEGAPESYDFGPDAGFGGGASVVIPNPDRSGINTTAQVAQMQKFTAEVFGGSTLSLGSDIDFSRGQAFNMKVWASRPVEVLFKLEDTTSDPPIPENGRESFVDHSGGGMWEELCFEFPGDLSNFTSSKITFIFDLGILGDAENDPDTWTFYFDEIGQTDSCDDGGGGEPLPLISSFGNGSFETGDLTNWVSDGSVTVGAPGVGAYAGTSAAQLTTTGGTGVALVTQTFAANPGDEVNFSAWMLSEAALPAGDTFGLAKIVFKDAAGIALVPASASIGALNSGDNPGIDSEPLLNSGSPVNTWVFTEAQGVAPAGTTQVELLLLNVDFAGGENPMWFDGAEAELVTGQPGPEALFTDFEGDPASYDFGPDLGFGGGVSTVIANPDMSGLNTTAQVVQMTRTAESNFGGSTLTLGSNIDFAAGEAFKMKVWASRPVPVKFKLETANIERDVNHSGSGMWEELCFDFTGATSGLTSGAISFFFDLGAVGDLANNPGDWTFYYDEIEQVESCGGGGFGELAINGDFELGNLDGFDLFPGGGTITADNTENNTAGGMWSAHVVAGPGNNPVLKQSFLAAGTVSPGDTVMISFDMKGSAVAGGVVFPELIDEKSDGGATGQLLDTIAAPTPDWTTYFYSPTAGPDVAGGITFQIAVVCGGDPACSNNVFIDNVSVVFMTGGG